MANFIETLKLNANGNTVPSAPHSTDDQIYPRTLFEAVYTNANINLVTYFNNLRLLYKITDDADNPTTVKYINKDPMALSNNASSVVLFRLSGSIIELEPNQGTPTAYKDSETGNIVVTYGDPPATPESFVYNGETKIESIALS